MARGYEMAERHERESSERPQVGEALDQMEKWVALLMETEDRVESRFTEVLSPPTPPGPVDVENRPDLVPLALRIHDLVQRVQMVNRRLEAVIERAEV